MAHWRGILGYVFLVSLFVGVIWVTVAPGFKTASEMEITYGQKRRLLARLEALPEQEDRMTQQLDQLSLAAASRYLYEGDGGNVQSLIQRDVRQLALDSGIQVNASRPVGFFSQNGPLIPVSVQVDFTCTHRTWVAFLQQLEARQPLLRVTRLSARIQKPSSEQQPADLAISMQVTGYMGVDTEKGTGDQQ